MRHSHEPVIYQKPDVSGQFGCTEREGCQVLSDDEKFICKKDKRIDNCFKSVLNHDFVFLWAVPSAILRYK